MHITEWYFAFYKRATLKDLRAGSSWTTILGHVEAYGYTEDQNWLSFDPRSRGTRISVMHMHDDVVDFMASRHEAADEIWRTRMSSQLLIPVHVNMTCATQCAALIGLRAFTPRGFRNKLQRNGAEKIHVKAERRPGSEA